MAFTLKEQEIINWSIKNGKTVPEMQAAVNRYRATGSPVDPNKPVAPAPSGFVAALKDIPSDIIEGFKGAVGAVTTGIETADIARTQVERGEISPLVGTAKTIGGGLRAGAGVIGEGFITLAKLFASPVVEEAIKNKTTETLKPILESAPVQAVFKKYEESTPEQKAIIDSFLGTAEGLTAMFGLPPAGKLAEKGIKTVVGAGKRMLTGVYEALPEIEKITGIADQALSYANNIKNRVQISIAESSVNPQLKESAKRLFLQGTKRLENPIADYDNFLIQSKKALTDTKVDPAIALVGSEIGDALNTVVKQRRAVGEIMGEELKKIGGIKTNIADTYTNLETSLKDAGLTYNAQTKKLIVSNISKMTKEDITLLQQYIADLNRLGAEPTIAQIDAHIARTTGLVNNFKASKGIVETTNAERLVKSSQASLRNQFDPIKTGNTALKSYADARRAYAELSNFIDEGSGYVGKVTQSGDFAKDASLAKSAVQSVLNNGKKDWLIQLEALTGEPVLDRAVLALQAMKDAGDFRGLSLLQIMSDGTVPTSRAGFTQKILDFAVEKGKEVVAGMPEEQTRAFLKELMRQPQ